MTKLTAGERFMRIETKLDIVSDEVKEIKIMLKEHTVWEEQKYVEIDKRYAHKEDVISLKAQVDALTKNAVGWVKTLVPWGFTILMLIITIWSVVK